ncbi:hypothetical protein Tco_0757757 [Tanacetum coccineum]
MIKTRVILPIFSNPTRNNTHLCQTNRIRLPQVPNTQTRPTVSPLWNANVTARTCLSITIGISSKSTIRVPRLQESKKYATILFSTTIITTVIFFTTIITTTIQNTPSPRPREPKRKQKRTGKQPVVELDEGDENEDMETRRLNIRWNDKEEILLAEAWIEHSQDNNIGKDQRDKIYWNKIIEDFHDRTTGPVRTKNMLTGKWTRMHDDCQRFNTYYKQTNRKSGENEADLIETVKTVYLERVGKKFQYPHVWKILQEYPKWDAAEPIDGDNLQEGSQSESVSSLVSQDYRCKCDAAQRAYEVQMEKDLAIKKCEEMKFLMIDTSNLPHHKRAFIERQQAEIMRKYQDAGADD